MSSTRGDHISENSVHFEDDFISLNYVDGKGNIESETIRISETITASKETISLDPNSTNKDLDTPPADISSPHVAKDQIELATSTPSTSLSDSANKLPKKIPIKNKFLRNYTEYKEPEPVVDPNKEEKTSSSFFNSLYTVAENVKSYLGYATSSEKAINMHPYKKVIKVRDDIKPVVRINPENTGLFEKHSKADSNIERPADKNTERKSTSSTASVNTALNQSPSPEIPTDPINLKKYILKSYGINGEILAWLEACCRDIHNIYSDDTSPPCWTVLDPMGRPTHVLIKEIPNWDAQTIKADPLKKEDLVINCLKKGTINIPLLDEVDEIFIDHQFSFDNLKDDEKISAAPIIEKLHTQIEKQKQKMHSLQQLRDDNKVSPVIFKYRQKAINKKVDKLEKKKKILIDNENKIHSISVKDLKNYRIIKAQASILTVAYVFAEDDLHRRNLGKLKRIDFDMFLWIFLHFFKKCGVIDTLTRGVDVTNRLKLSSANLSQLPRISGKGPFYSPTRDAFNFEVGSSTFTSIADMLTQNLYKDYESEPFRSLEQDDVFNYHKYRTLLRMQLIDSEMYTSIATSHIPADLKCENITPEFTFYQNPIKVNGEKLVKVMSDVIHERVKVELHDCMMDMKNLSTELNNHGKKHFRQIKKAMEKRNQRLKKKNKKYKAKDLPEKYGPEHFVDLKLLRLDYEKFKIEAHKDLTDSHLEALFKYLIKMDFKFAAKPDHPFKPQIDKFKTWVFEQSNFHTAFDAQGQQVFKKIARNMKGKNESAATLSDAIKFLNEYEGAIYNQRSLAESMVVTSNTVTFGH